MDKELRVLILEDMPADAELVRHELRQAGIKFISEVVDTRDAYIKVIGEFNPEIILSDYALPNFDGMAALELKKELKPDIPFIIVTGSINEQTAVECIKAGADDYVTKDHLKHLVTAVNNAFKKKELEKDKEKAEQEKIKLLKALENAAAQWRTTFDSMNDCVMMLDSNYRITRVNKAMARMLNLPFSEIIGRRCFELVHGTNVPPEYCLFDLVIADGKEHSAEVFEPKTNRHYYISITPHFDDSGNQIGSIHVMSDITERKLAEEELNRLSNAVKISADSIVITDVAGKIIFVNEATLRMYGVDDEKELVGKSAFDIFVPENREKAFSSMEAVLAREQMKNEEFVILGKNGRIIHLEMSVALIKGADGKPTGFVGLSRDITERKQAEEALRESEEKFKYVFDNSIIGKSITFLSGEIHVNKAFSDMLGYSQEELKNHKWKDISHPDDVEETQRLIDHILSGDKESARFIKRYLHKNGSVVWADVGTSVRKDKEGKPLYFITNISDITERKQAEEEREEMLLRQDGVNVLQQSLLAPAPLEQKLKSITDGIVRFFGADFCRVWLIRPGDFCEKGCIHAELKEGPHMCRYRDRCLHLLSSSGRYTHTNGKGHRRVPFGCYKIGLVASGEEHKLITNDVENDPHVHDREWARNLGLVSFAGYQLRVPGGQAMGVMALFAKHPISPAEDAMLDGLSSTIALVVQQAEGEEALSQSEMRYRTIGRLSSDFAYSCLHTGEKGYEVDWITDAFYTLTGISEAELRKRRSWLSISHPEDREMAIESMGRLRPGESDVREFRVMTKSGKVLTFINHMECKADPGTPGGLRVYGAVKDITEHKQLEEQFHQAMKMESIGRLAGGVAHDFNNALTPILAIGQAMLEDIGPKHPLSEDIKDIMESAHRCVSLTRQLLAFARKQPRELKVINLNDVIVNMEKMLSRVIGEDISLVKMLDPGLGNVKADIGQMEQILANLAVNSRDAMPQGGQLTVETKNVFLNDEYAANHLSVKPGNYVMMAVSDSGSGMDEQTKSHLFEPFFTTKEKGKGTGLGLATVFGIVKNSGGEVWCYSEPGVGTTFKIYLPRIEEEAIKISAPVQFRASKYRGTETILVVEDDESVRRVVKRILGEQGYKIIEAANGEEAIKRCLDYMGFIQLMITDVVMPGMSGRELANRLSPTFPSMKILYISGYTDNAIVHHGILEEGISFVQKPFTNETIIVKVRELLDKA